MSPTSFKQAVDHGRERRAFTLIELLVVIAIIAMLIAILLPSLEAARRASKRATCLAHIRNIASSSRIYEADDPAGWGIPVHPGQYTQDAANPTYVGAYEWGGKSGIGWPDFVDGSPPGIYGSKYGTLAGFGPATRPMNGILYTSGFKDYLLPDFDRAGAQADTRLRLDLFKCPADDGPPRGGHCQDWLDQDERSSFDHFGNSYAANLFMVHTSSSTTMRSNSPYMRPTSRVPTPSRVIYYEENIGRWAWAARRDPCTFITGVYVGPTRAIRGWHGRDWTYNRVFVDAHAETQRVYLEGTQDNDGYVEHYRSEDLGSYPPWPGYPNPDYRFYICVLVRGVGWQKDTLPSTTIETGVHHPGERRPSYEDCVSQKDW